MKLTNLVLSFSIIAVPVFAQELPPIDAPPLSDSASSSSDESAPNAGTEETPVVVDVNDPDANTFDDAVGAGNSNNGHGHGHGKKAKKAKKPHPNNFGAIVSARAHELKGDRAGKKGFGSWVNAQRRNSNSTASSVKRESSGRSAAENGSASAGNSGNSGNSRRGKGKK